MGGFYKSAHFFIYVNMIKNINTIMLSKKETEKLGLLGKKITYKDPMTGKIRTVEIDAENCGVFSKEEEERVFYTRRNSKRFDINNYKI